MPAGVDYGSREQALAIAIVDEMVARGVSGGGGGGNNTVIATPAESALQSESPLTAPSSTPARSMAGYNKLTYQVDVANIGTNVVVRVEGNLTGSNFVNLNAQNQDTTLTANGSYLFTFEGKLSVVRFTLVSISSGVPSVTAHLLRGN